MPVAVVVFSSTSPNRLPRHYPHLSLRKGVGEIYGEIRRILSEYIQVIQVPVYLRKHPVLLGYYLDKFRTFLLGRYPDIWGGGNIRKYPSRLLTMS